MPGAEWQQVAPAQVGLDAAALERIAATARDGKSNCLVVVRHGKLAGEWYFNGTTPQSTQNVFSVTKSVASTLVGIAQDDGDLRVGASASRWVPEWRGTPARQVTVRNLLSNDSGREWSPAIDYDRMIRAADRTQFAVDLGQPDRPGQVWAYNNSAIQTLQRVLQNATGQEVGAYAQERMFGPLGMTRTRMTRDLAGNAQTFQGLESSCRDLARFGLLMLRGGRWGSERIVSRRLGRARDRRLVHADERRLRLPLVAQPVRRPGGPARARPPARRHWTPRHRARGWCPARRPDTYWALGLGNQVVQVDPGTDTVVVRLGTPELSPQPPTFGPAEASKVVTTAVIGR